jgi:hypothetical protein
MSDQRDLAFDTEIDPDSERFDNEGGHQETEAEPPSDLLPTDEIDPDSLVILEEDEDAFVG